MRRSFLLALLLSPLFGYTGANIIVFRIVADTPQFNVSGGAANFGDVCSGTVNSVNFTLTNATGSAVSGGNVTILDSGNWNVPSPSFSIAPRSSVTIPIQFVPIASVPVSGSNITAQVVFATSNAGSKTNTVYGRSSRPITANFTITSSTGAAPLTVTFTSADENDAADIYAYWSTGDGPTDNINGSPVNYTYTVPGTYSPTLRIVSLSEHPCNQSATQTCVGCISVTGTNVGSFVVTPNYSVVNICTGVPTPFVLVASNLTGSVANDGTTTVSIGGGFTVTSGATFTIAATPGTTNITISLTATNASINTGRVVFATSNAGVQTNTIFATSILPPTALFSGSPQTGSVPLTVTFTDTSTGTITNRNWNFGDSFTTNTVNTTMVHSYTNSPSTNTVRLITAGLCGISTNTKTAYIIVTNLSLCAQVPTNFCTGAQSSLSITGTMPDAAAGGAGTYVYNQTFYGEPIQYWIWDKGDYRIELEFNTDTCAYNIDFSFGGADWWGSPDGWFTSENTLQCCGGQITGTFTATGTGLNAGKVVYVTFTTCVTESGYFVDNSLLASANNGTSWASAWTNLNSASGVAAGSTVYISGGTTNQTYWVTNAWPNAWNVAAGTSNNPVTYKVGQSFGHNGIVIINGNGVAANPYACNDWVTLDGNYANSNHLVFTNFTANSIICDGATGFVLRYATIFDRVRILEGRNIEFDHVIKYAKPGEDIAFMLGRGTAPSARPTDYMDYFIHDCIIQATRNLVNTNDSDGDDCVQARGGLTFSNCTFEGVLDVQSRGINHQDGIQLWQDSYFVKAINCYFKNLGNSGIFCSLVHSNQGDIQVLNCVVEYTDAVWTNGTGSYGIFIGANGADANYYFKNVVVANNTVVNGNHGIRLGDSDIASRYTNCWLVNNLTVNNDGVKGPAAAVLGQVTCLYNKAVGASTNAGAAQTVYPGVVQPANLAGPANTNWPTFVSYTSYGANNNLHLSASDTGAIGNGTNWPSTYFTIDKDGVTRPQGSLWDLGAYECTNAGSAMLSPEEWYGPYPSWKNVKNAYGATGDGSTDDTASFSNALANLGVGTNSPVLYIPAGDYKITQQLKLIDRSKVQIVGTNTSARLFWAGASGTNTVMLLMDGVDQSVFSRFTLDGMGVCSVLLNYSKLTGSGPFPTACEFSDLVFTNAATGLLGARAALQGSAEALVLRCTFANLTNGLLLADQNSCDWWAWSSKFSDCVYGMGSNGFQPGGSEHAYSNVFLNCSGADIKWTAGGNYSSRWNYSSNSAAHYIMDAGGSHSSVIQGLVSVDPTGIPIQIYEGDTAIIEDCTIAGGTTGTIATVDADLTAMGNATTSTMPTGLLFIVSGRKVELGTTASVVRSTMSLAQPVLPSTPARSTRYTVEPAALTGAAIQTALNSAGSTGTVHIPFTNYTFSATLTVPSNCVVVGDGLRTNLDWTGGENGAGRMMDATFAHLQDFRMYGDYAMDGIRVTGARSVLANQAVFSFSTNAAVNLAAGTFEGRAFLHQYGTVNSKEGLGVRVTGGTLTINGGASAGQRRYYEVTGGTALVRDTWSEAGAPQYWFYGSNGNFSVINNRIAIPVATNAVYSIVANVGAVAGNLVDGPIFTTNGTVVAANNSTTTLGAGYITATTSLNNRNTDGDNAQANAGDVTALTITNGFTLERSSRPNDAVALRIRRLTIERAGIALDLRN